MIVFVYGTLADADRAGSVLDDRRYEGPAVLSGLHRVEGAYPTLAPGGRTDGRLLRTAETDRLDAYEGVDRGPYVRVAVPSENGPVQVYVGDPERLGAPAEWPGEGPFARRVRTYIAAHEVSVRRPTR